MEKHGSVFGETLLHENCDFMMAICSNALIMFLCHLFLVYVNKECYFKSLVLLLASARSIIWKLQLYDGNRCILGL